MLRSNDKENGSGYVHLRDSFNHRGHFCIVTDLQSVFDFLKGNDYAPFPNSHVQSIARQLLTSVACTLFSFLARFPLSCIG